MKQLLDFVMNSKAITKIASSKPKVCTKRVNKNSTSMRIIKYLFDNPGLVPVANIVRDCELPNKKSPSHFLNNHIAAGRVLIEHNGRYHKTKYRIHPEMTRPDFGLDE